MKPCEREGNRILLEVITDRKFSTKNYPADHLPPSFLVRPDRPGPIREH